MLSKAFHFLIGLSLLIVAFISLFLIYIYFNDYKPEEISSISVESNKELILPTNTELNMTTYNIGYCGLDKNQDFFMDGGTMSRSSSKSQTQINLNEILSFLDEQESDFLLLQEVDKGSSRSFNINQYEILNKTLTQYGSTFGTNYLVKWVPVPIINPMGYVNSGIATFSKYRIDSATRIQLPGKEMWVRQLFDLDRCITENRVPVANGKEFVLVNLHLSAYDKGGKVRQHQISYLQSYITKEYQIGNYIVLGGDWNHLLSAELTKRRFSSWPEWLVELPKDFLPEGFKWVVDEKTWTVRDNKTKYVENETFTTIIDGFLFSPNITVIAVNGHDLGFEHSDHNPVSCIFELK